MGDARKNSTGRIVVVVAAAVVLAVAGRRIHANHTAARAWDAAVEAANDGRYDEAVKGYEAAWAASPGDKRIARNADAVLADAHHRQAVKLAENAADAAGRRAAAEHFERAAAHREKVHPDADAEAVPSFAAAGAYLAAGNAWFLAAPAGGPDAAAARERMRENGEKALRAPGADDDTKRRAQALLRAAQPKADGTVAE